MSRHRSVTLRYAFAAAAVASMFLLIPGAASAQPTVNGLFYGDGDDAYYVPYATSTFGSKVYIYYDAPTTTLFVALVVDRSVNDNVFGSCINHPPPPTASSTAYMASAGWGAGAGQQRSAEALTNSEYATFTFECEDTPRTWTWQHGYACLRSGTWFSDEACPTGTQTGPPSLQADSSFAININTWNAAGVKPWNLHQCGTGQGDWKSPFATDNPNTDPANSPYTVIGLEGYPATGQIGYNNTYDYEWPMVYEWSVDLGPDGANCGGNSLFVITGESHHSPLKEFWECDPLTETCPCPPDDDCFPPDPDPDPLLDFGDLPISYGTLSADDGARHEITVSGPYLGAGVQLETDGTPSPTASLSPDDDGVTANVTSNWTVGSNQTIDAEVANAPSGAVLAGWFDWNGDGDVDDLGEFFLWPVVQGTNQLPLVVGAGFDWESDDLFARLRLFSSATAAPGGILSQASSVGVASDGEVEDYVFAEASLPVTLNSFASDGTSAGEMMVRWQTASETDNVGFELQALVGEQWRTLSPVVATKGANSALPQTYEVRITAPEGLTAFRLVGYDSRGREDRFGPFAPGTRVGEPQRPQRIDWAGPRAEREKRLRDRGFQEVGSTAPASSPATAGEPAREARWKRLGAEPVRGSAARHHGSRAMADEVETPRRAASVAASRSLGQIEPVLVHGGAQTHVAVVQTGVQRVTYEALRAGGLDLAGIKRGDIAVTWRGEPVARWIDGGNHFGPGSAIEFVGRAPQGNDALYIGSALYQISVDPLRAREAERVGRGNVKTAPASYTRETLVDKPLLFHSQSPTGDPWIERTVLARNGSPATLTLDVPVAGPISEGTARLFLRLGTITDLLDIRGPDGQILEEHNVEVSFAGPGGAFTPVTTASTSGQRLWEIETDLPPGLLQPGTNRIQLRFSTGYLFALSVVDRYGVRHSSPFRGPTLDFAPTPAADGYRIDGFASPAVVAYAEQGDGSLQRIDLASAKPSANGFAVEVRNTAAVRYWVTGQPHAPQVFTTEAPGDLLSGHADLVILADSSFVGTAGLDEYVAQKAAFSPVVIDLEDVYNSVGFGMALPGAITDFLRARDAVSPFTHVQLVGADCYDRRNYVSSCISFVPLPTAQVGVTFYSPSQNRLVDLDGDGVGDKAIGQFSARDANELATIVGKGASWEASGLPGSGSALMIAEETDGIHDFAAQIDRLRGRAGWAGSEVLDMTAHPNVATARESLHASLDAGRAVTLFSGHSSPTVWASRGLVTTTSAPSLTNAGRPTVMLPLACETTYDVSPNANVLGHQLMFAGEQGALAISGAVSLSSLGDNERMAAHVLDGLQAGLTLGEAVLLGRQALGSEYQTLQDNWITQGDVTTRVQP